MSSSPPLPDLLREQDARHPVWLRLIFLAAAVVCLAAGLVGWLIPVITGIPFYAAGLVFLGLASDRVRRWINRLERRLVAGLEADGPHAGQNASRERATSSHGRRA